MLLLTARVCEVVDRGVRRQQLAGLGSDDAHFVCWVRKLKHFEPKLLEVLVSRLRRTIKNHVAFGENDNAVKHHEDVGRWLVNRCNDARATIRLSTHQLAYFEGSERVQATGRFVQQDQRWVGHKFVAYRHSLFLATRKTLAEKSSDYGILAISEPKALDNRCYKLLDF